MTDTVTRAVLHAEFACRESTLASEYRRTMDGLEAVDDPFVRSERDLGEAIAAVLAVLTAEADWLYDYRGLPDCFSESAHRTHANHCAEARKAIRRLFPHGACGDDLGPRLVPEHARGDVEPEWDGDEPEYEDWDAHYEAKAEAMRGDE